MQRTVPRQEQKLEQQNAAKRRSKQLIMDRIWCKMRLKRWIKAHKSSAIKMIQAEWQPPVHGDAGRQNIRQGHGLVAWANPTNSTPIPALPITKANLVGLVAVESHFVVLDIEKESMPLKHPKNGLTKMEYKTYRRTANKNCTREATLTQPPTLRLSGKTLNPSG